MSVVYIRCKYIFSVFFYGVRGGLTVACWTTKHLVRGSNSGQGRNFDLDFCSTHAPILGPQVSGYQRQPKACNSVRVRKRGRAYGCRYFRPKEKNMIEMQ